MSFMVMLALGRSHALHGDAGIGVESCSSW